MKSSQNKKFNVQSDYFQPDGGDAGAAPDPNADPNAAPAQDDAPADDADDDTTFTPDQLDQMKQMASSGDYEGLGKFVAGIIAPAPAAPADAAAPPAGPDDAQ